MQSVNADFSNVLSILKSSGIADNDIKTTSFTVNPNYSYLNGSSTIIGQSAR